MTSLNQNVVLHGENKATAWWQIVSELKKNIMSDEYSKIVIY